MLSVAAAPSEPKLVLCIKWGVKYGPNFVNLLYAMVARNLTPPFRFICFTDDRTGIRSEVEVYPLPELGCEPPSTGRGKWRKTGLWGHSLFDLTGVALFLDLDVVVTGSLDDLFAFGSPNDVILARNWIRPLERVGQTSVFRYPIGKHGYMLDNFAKDPLGTQAEFMYEQRYVTKRIQGGVKFFPSSWIVHFRLNCLGPWFLRYLRPARLPAKARVVIFPGKPKPADAILGRWSPESPALPPLAHLAKAFGGDHEATFARRIKHFIMPVPWVAEHWRD